MKRLLVFLSFFALAMLVASCAAAPAAQRVVETVVVEGYAPAAPAPTAAPPTAALQLKRGMTTGESADQATNLPTTERMIVYTTSLRIEFADTEKAVDQIRALASNLKGYVADSNVSRDSKNRLRGTITLRLPAESLDSAIAQLKALGLKVLGENSNANDVTEEYTDLDARRKNLEAYEVELQKLLETVRERTGKAEDILAVYNELTRVRGEIEQIKGRQVYLERTSAMATVTVELVPHEEVVIAEPDQWLPDRTMREALRSLVSTLQALADIAIWLILYVLPVLIVILLPFVILALIIRWLVLRGRKAKKVATV
jgi:hypothetical protein